MSNIIFINEKMRNESLSELSFNPEKRYLIVLSSSNKSYSLLNSLIKFFKSETRYTITSDQKIYHKIFSCRFFIEKMTMNIVDNFNTVLSILKSYGDHFDTIIMITNLDYIHSFIGYYNKNNNNNENGWYKCTDENGEIEYIASKDTLKAP